MKKYIESVFFLKQDVRRDGEIIEQTLLAISAGVAMVFATAIAFYFQHYYGNLTILLFFALVVSYMLKDRILNTPLSEEQIIQYKKIVKLYPKKFGGDLPDEDIMGLTDITRFNFHRFIQYMDDPEKEYILVKKGEVYSKIADKIYTINIIQKFFTEEVVEFNRYRMIMNRSGIKRIEEIELEDSGKV